MKEIAKLIVVLAQKSTHNDCGNRWEETETHRSPTQIDHVWILSCIHGTI